MPTLKTFAEQTTIFAKNQPQYSQLPAHKCHDGTVTCCWNLSWRERLKVLLTGELWHQILTFNKPLQPQKMLVDKPALAEHAENEMDVKA
jgi:hypothetical protein